jgi:hypothetical protein
MILDSWIGSRLHAATFARGKECDLRMQKTESWGPISASAEGTVFHPE